MVSIGTAAIGRGLRRLDTVHGAMIVLTVNAIVFSGIAGVGALFLMFFFADETGTWGRLWPLVAGWVAAAALGAASAISTVRFARRPHEAPRVWDGVTALVTAVASGAWLILPEAASPVVLFTAAPFAIANVAAAWVLFGAANAPAPATEFPAFTPAAGDEGFNDVGDISEMSEVAGRAGADGSSEGMAVLGIGVRTAGGSDGHVTSSFDGRAAGDLGGRAAGGHAAGGLGGHEAGGFGGAGLGSGLATGLRLGTGFGLDSSGAFRGLRGRAALNSLGGIQPSRRARAKARR
ncbi:hypothetical protein [Actinoplanes sp. NPDC023714]|uniref:hypothetical protein n=1 Tax=Actinoplanes sp. NPDC023714 TaxID=3154322 RepID=UPI0033EA5D1C